MNQLAKANGNFVQSSNSLLLCPWWWLVLHYAFLASGDFSYEAIRVLDSMISEDLSRSARLVDVQKSAQAEEKISRLISFTW